MNDNLSHRASRTAQFNEIACNSNSTTMEPLTWLQVILLAIVQGLTEFLPVSSSGHLVIAEHLLHVRAPDLTAVNVILHVGTLASILVFYRKSILNLITEDRRVVWLLAAGTLPAATIGLVIEKFFSDMIELPIVAGAMLPITGLMLIWMAGRDGELEYAKLSLKQALVIGLFQAFALLPGISRSGATIVAGLLVGLKRPAAATFSFLLAIPAIALAAGYKTLKMILEPELGARLDMLAVGALVSFVVGLAALWLVVKLLNQGRLHWFALWCIPVGLGVIIWQISQWLS